MGMLIRFVTGVWILATAAMLCGCRSLIQPSNTTRHESYARYEKQFTGNQTNVLRETYLILSCSRGIGTAAFSTNSSGSWHLTFTRSKGSKGFNLSQGLAVALTHDGYLLTAAHVLESKNFVIGRFNGRLGLKTARVVFKADSKPHADVALIKVGAELQRYVTFGPKPKVGEQVFAVVCNHRKRPHIHFAFSAAAGKVLNVRRGPAGSSVDLVYTDTPLWEGDSGGPLLTSTGQLIGILHGCVFHWYGIYLNVRKVCFFPKISFFPHEKYIQHIIAEDRASHKAPNALTP